MPAQQHHLERYGTSGLAATLSLAPSRMAAKGPAEFATSFAPCTKATQALVMTSRNVNGFSMSNALWSSTCSASSISSSRSLKLLPFVNRAFAGVEVISAPTASNVSPAPAPGPDPPRHSATR